MRVLKIFIGFLVAVIVIFLALGFFLPRDWRVEQSVVIAAPADTIYPLIANPRRWTEWAITTRETDASVKDTFSGPEEGVGAKWRWEGTKMGTGELLITQADPKIGVTVENRLVEKESVSKGTLTFSPDGAGTRVTWVDEGTLPVISGGFFRRMIQNIISDNLQRGLKELKKVAEQTGTGPNTPGAVEPGPSLDGGAF
ncbi:MAG: SRPBCC family protein [Myxococcaceae bacterium]